MLFLTLIITTGLSFGISGFAHMPFGLQNVGGDGLFERGWVKVWPCDLPIPTGKNRKVHSRSPPIWQDLCLLDGGYLFSPCFFPMILPKKSSKVDSWILPNEWFQPKYTWFSPRFLVGLFVQPCAILPKNGPEDALLCAGIWRGLWFGIFWSNLAWRGWCWWRPVESEITIETRGANGPMLKVKSP